MEVHFRSRLARFLEREWPVYRRVSAHSSWTASRTSFFRQGLDLAWANVVEGSSLPSAIADKCFEEIPDDPRGTLLVAAFAVSNAIADMLQAIVDGNGSLRSKIRRPQSSPVGVLLETRGLMLDNLPADRSVEYPEISEIHDLVDREMEHQSEDVRILSDASSSAPLGKKPFIWG